MGYSVGYSPTDAAARAEKNPTEKALQAIPVVASLEMLSKITRNVCQKADPKYRRLRLSNARVKAALVDVEVRDRDTRAPAWQCASRSLSVPSFHTTLTTAVHSATQTPPNAVPKRHIRRRGVACSGGDPGNAPHGLADHRRWLLGAGPQAKNGCATPPPVGPASHSAPSRAHSRLRVWTTPRCVGADFKLVRYVEAAIDYRKKEDDKQMQLRLRARRRAKEGRKEFVKMMSVDNGGEAKQQ